MLQILAILPMCLLLTYIITSQKYFFLQVCIHVSADENCLEIVKSVKEVESCPTTKEENDRAASLKNCGKITLGKTCNFTRVYYHCVINGYRNKTLEVCAPWRLIVGGNVYIHNYTSAGIYSQNEISHILQTKTISNF